MQFAKKTPSSLQTIEAEKQQDNTLVSTKESLCKITIKNLSYPSMSKYFFLSVIVASLNLAGAQENSTSSQSVSEIDFSSSNVSFAQITTANSLGNFTTRRENNFFGKDDSLSKTVLSLLIGLMSLFTIVGNLMVIMSIAIFRKLRKIPNMFIVSLATADLIMGGIVVPLGSQDVVAEKWLLDNFACDLWTSIDILSVTASISTLCAISLDRFVAITMPFKYSTKMTKNRARLIIGFIWTISATIAFVPINLGWWKTDKENATICYNNPECCDFIINTNYAVVSSLISFYIPLFVMIFAYSIVFKIAIQKRTKIRNREGVFRRASMPGSRSLLWGRGEYRAVFTMGIIMGTFITCWLPFFIANIAKAFDDKCMSQDTFRILNWIGYANSFFNPIIYCHSKEFRRAFKRLLLCSLCREGYQQTSRASLSVSYTPSFSLRSSAHADSSIFQLTKFFRSSSTGSQRRASRLSTECKKTKKASPVNGYVTPTNATSRISNGNAVIYGQRSSRFEYESDEVSSTSCGSEVCSTNHFSVHRKSVDKPGEADNRRCQDDDGKLLEIVSHHHPSRVRGQRSKSTSAHREGHTCKHVIFKTASHNDICNNKLDEDFNVHLSESSERSSQTSVETTLEECRDVDIPLLQNDSEANLNINTPTKTESLSSTL